MISAARLLAERPRRILEVLDIPSGLKITQENQEWMLTSFMGLPVIIHPSKAHLAFGCGDELFKQLPEVVSPWNSLYKNGDMMTILGESISFVETIYKPRSQSIKDLVPRYDESEDARLLTEPHIRVENSKFRGTYWRADFLCYIMSSSRRGRSSYEACLLHMLSVLSPLRTLIPPVPLGCWEDSLGKGMYATVMLQKYTDEACDRVEGLTLTEDMRRMIMTDFEEHVPLNTIPFEEAANFFDCLQEDMARRPIAPVLPVDESVVLPHVAGVIGEDQAEPLINQAAGETFGRLKRTAGVQGRSADFIHEDLNYGFILHEVKNGDTTISSASGVDKLLRDVEDCEKTRGKPCLAAVIYSWRSVIASHRDHPIVEFTASNGHTRIICVNNIRQQSRWRGDILGSIDIFRDAISRVVDHIRSRLVLFYNISSALSSERSALLHPILGIRNGSVILGILGESNNIEQFITKVMTPTASVEPIRGRPMSRTGGLRRPSIIRSSTLPRRTVQWNSNISTVAPASSQSSVPTPTPPPPPIQQQTALITTERGAFIPPEWREILNVSSPWVPERRTVAESIMRLCRIGEGSIKRHHLAGRIARDIGPSRSTTGIKSTLVIILNPRFLHVKELHGLQWRS